MSQHRAHEHKPQEQHGSTVEGINVVNPTGKFTPSYAKSDMERIYHDAKPHSWKELVDFIEKKGDQEWHITPGEAVAMKDDISRLMQHNVPFTDNPDKAFDEAHKYRAEDRAKEEPKLRQEGKNLSGR